MKICSLLPGATEVVAALGLADKLVGISHECDFPADVRNKPVMVRAAIDSQNATSQEIDRQVKAHLEGGSSLYTLDEARFQEAQPDVVIAQELCHVCAITPDQLRKSIRDLGHSPELLSLNPTTLDQMLADVLRIGRAVGREAQAKAYAEALRTRLQSIHDQVASLTDRPRVACIEWLDPLYIAGHWIPEMVSLAGGSDPLGTPGAPSRTLTWQELLGSAPDVVVFMPCGFSIDRTLREVSRLASRYDWEALPAIRNGRAFAVDATSYFSRPGPRLVEGVGILASLCHPARMPGLSPERARHVHLVGAHRA